MKTYSNAKNAFHFTFLPSFRFQHAKDFEIYEFLVTVGKQWNEVESLGQGGKRRKGLQNEGGKKSCWNWAKFPFSLDIYPFSTWTKTTLKEKKRIILPISTAGYLPIPLCYWAWRTAENTSQNITFMLGIQLNISKSVWWNPSPGKPGSQLPSLIPVPYFIYYFTLPQACLLVPLSVWESNWILQSWAEPQSHSQLTIKTRRKNTEQAHKYLPLVRAPKYFPLSCCVDDFQLMFSSSHPLTASPADGTLTRELTINFLGTLALINSNQFINQLIRSKKNGFFQDTRTSSRRF